ncbi:MAG: enoyl-CoA hydratase/isomerase family protein [Pseudomonadota bacterium]
MNYSTLLYDVRDRIGFITLNRPEKLNALTQTSWKEIRQALKVGERDPGVAIHLITGNDRAFCAGDDISVLTQVKNLSDAEDLFLHCIYGLVDTMIHLQKPVISAVNGLAYGGGCEIVLLSDIAVASEKATFALPEGRIGAFPAIFSVFGPVALGIKVSNELTLLGEPISAHRAFDIGLVNRVAPQQEFMAEAVRMAQQLMKSSQMSLKITRETSSKILGERLHDFWIACQRFAKEVSRTEDFLEGATAFVEKRSPRFVGH